MSDFDNSIERIPGEDWDRFLPYIRGEYDPQRDPTAQQRQQFQNGAHMDTPYSPHFPYRLAAEIQDYIQQRASTEDHDIGHVERAEWAEEYTRHLIDQNAVDPSYVAYQGLQAWRLMHGRDLRGQ